MLSMLPGPRIPVVCTLTLDGNTDWRYIIQTLRVTRTALSGGTVPGGSTTWSPQDLDISATPPDVRDPDGAAIEMTRRAIAGSFWF